MSLINQMLKDIEKRANSKAKPEIALLNLEYSSQINKSISRNWKVIVTLLSIFFFTFLMTKHIFNHSIIKKASFTLTKSIALSDQSISSTSNLSASPDPLITPVVLTGITLQIQSNTTYLRFLLTQQTLYRINYHMAENKLILFLDHTHITTSLPPVNYINSAIKHMEMINQPNGDLKIILTLNTGVEIKHLELNEVGKFPELQLEFLLQDAESANIQNQTVQPLATIHQNDPLKKLVINMSVEEEYQKALNSVASGNSQQAINLLTELVTEYPEYQPSRELLAKILIEQGDTKNADRLLQVGLRQQPNYVPFIELRARILANTGKTQQALSLLQRATPVLTDNPDYYAFIAALYQRQNEPSMAEKLYEQLLSINPNKAVWWVGLGIALESLNKHSEAREAFAKASTSDGLTPELNAYIASRT